MKSQKKRKKANTPSLVDIYCGAGNFSEGFRQEGFKILKGFDIWGPAVKTFEFNHGVPCQQINVLNLASSVESIELIPDSTVITGSPPCISFSNSNKSGKGDKFLGKKLMRAYLKIVAVKKFKPKSILKAWYMENVGRSADHIKPSYTFKQLGLKDWARKIGKSENEIAIKINSNSTIINSADFGSPQMRKRLFVGEIIGQSGNQFPEPTHSNLVSENKSLYVTLKSIKESLPPPNLKESELNTEYSDPNYSMLSLPGKLLSDHFYDTGLPSHLWERSKFLKQNHPYMGKMSFPENEERPCRTVMATNIGSSRESIVIPSEFHRSGDGEYRTLTVRESACLMGFPLTYQFLGSPSNKLKLVGNAVCTHVSRSLARQVKKSLGMKVRSTPKLRMKVKDNKEIENLNTFTQKIFLPAKIKSKSSKFRMHLFKDGNLTVELSNYDLLGSKKEVRGKWKTFILYSNGEDYFKKAHEIRGNDFRKLEPVLIDHLKDGLHFIKVMNNGFSEKIPSGSVLQSLLERKLTSDSFHTPAELMAKVNEIISTHQNINKLITDKRLPFKKERIPLKQVMALYALNKVISVANSDS